MTMRRKMITEALEKAGAYGKEKAKALTETELMHPEDFREYTDRLADMGVIRRTPDGKYYLDGKTETK